ncbi:PDZ domain-containing protein, partial [Escherichia coli]
TRIGEIEPNSAAAQAGLQPGDRITAMDGRRMDDFFDVRVFTALRGGERVTIDYERDGQIRHTEATISTLREKDRFGNVSSRGR